MELPEILGLDPVQWVLGISAIIGATLGIYLTIKDKEIRFTISSYIVFNLLVIGRYILFLIYKQDADILTSTEATTINQISQISQIYIVWVIVFSELTKIIDCSKKKKFTTKYNALAKGGTDV